MARELVAVRFARGQIARDGIEQVQHVLRLSMREGQREADEDGQQRDMLAYHLGVGIHSE
ncbi:MAG: hypothetical protein IPK19_34770 [Chloroflexi bacterium]|nr:hypothetical protein [Chloroflexota bacterium]